MFEEDSQHNFTDKIEQRISLQDVITVTQNAVNDPTALVLSYQLFPYSADKLGFSASHLHLNVTYQKIKANSHETISFFVKAAPFEVESQVVSSNNLNIYDKESYIFDTVFPKFTENYKCDPWMPSCYLSMKDILVMEDLRNKGYKPLSRFFNDIEILKSGLTSIARFHGCSILAEAQLSETAKVSMTLIECYPKACAEIIFSRAEKVEQFMLSCKRIVVAVGKRLKYNIDKINRAFDEMYEIVKPSKKYRNVLCHADLWSNNMMFSESHSPPKCILVDYQVTRYAPLVLDILHFIYLNTSLDFRKKHEKDLVKLYHSVIEETIRMNDVTEKAKVPRMDEIMIGLEDLRLYGVGIAALYLPMGLLNQNVVTENTKSAEDCENFVFGDRLEVTMKYMEKDPVYKNIVEEVVTELAKISEKLYD